MLARADGTVVASAQRDHEVAQPHPGWVEQDAERIWWQEVRRCVPRAAGPSGRPAGGRVNEWAGSLSISGRRAVRSAAPSHPLRRRHARQLRDRPAQRAVRRRGDLRPLRVGAQLPGCRTQAGLAAPPRAGRVGAHQAVPDGALVPGGATVRRLRSRSPIREPVRPALRPPHRKLGAGLGEADRPRASAAPARVAGGGRGRGDRRGGARDGYPRGTPVAAGTIDAWSEAASVGVRRPGDLMLMYGSTMFLILVGDEPLVDKRLWSTAGSFPDTPNSPRAWPHRGRSRTGCGASAARTASTSSRARPRRPRPAAMGSCCCRTSPGSARPSLTPTPAG